jgi:hypothetical protein
MRTLSRFGFVAIVASLSSVVIAADKNSVSRGPKEDFIGVFYVQAAGLPQEDPIRCSDPSYPLRLDFSGVAYTNLGRATFTQSHCEGTDHAAARDGEEVITFDSGGETLYGTYSATVIVTPTTNRDGQVIIDGSYRNTGGTGSLEHMHGRGISAGVFNVFNGRGQITVTGTL